MTEEVDVYQMSHDDNERYFLDGVPYDGVAVERDESGLTMAQSTFRHGVEEGPAKTWRPDGTLESEYELHNGIPVGLAREWYRSGRISREINYDSHGFLQTSRTWDEAGNLIGEQDWKGAPRR